MPAPPKFRRIDGSITAPKGFKAAAVFCDIKKLGTGKGSDKGEKRDLALIVSDVPASVAGMFTTNQTCAAPVKLSALRVVSGRARAVVANSGNANACTGKQGLADATAMTAATARALHLREQDVLVCSTGRIGVPLPMANIRRGIAAAAPLLNSTLANGHAVAEAIMTSDTRPKEIAVELTAGGKKVRIGGVCKGAGMIQPGMSPTGARPASGLHATMLAFLTSDAAVEPRLLKVALETAVAQSFNRITIDGDMSTNDTVLLFANGLAGNIPTAPFQEALNFVTLELAKMIVRDGEGVTRFVTVRVHGARSATDADAVGRAIANSTLVKTSWCGGDPNWGRVLCAAGYSSARLDLDRIDLAYSAPGKNALTYSVRKGAPARVAFAKLVRQVAPPEFDLHVFLNAGKHESIIYTTDLTEEYVEFNKGNVSDPKSLGG